MKVKQKQIFILGLLLLLFSCNQNKSKLYYTETQIKSVMLDLYVAAEAMKKANDENKDSLKVVYLSQIEKIHNIEMEKYESDVKIIKRDPKKYTEIHKVVKDTMRAQYKRMDDATFKNIKKERATKKDTTKESTKELIIDSKKDSTKEMTKDSKKEANNK